MKTGLTEVPPGRLARPEHQTTSKPRAPLLEEHLLSCQTALALGGDHDWSLARPWALERVQLTLSAAGVNSSPIYVLQELTRRGWVHSRAADRPEAFWVPPEHRVAALGRLVHLTEESARRALARDPIPLPPEGRLTERAAELDVNLVGLLAEHRLRPPRVTQHGALYKRDQERLEQLVSPAARSQWTWLLSYLQSEDLLGYAFGRITAHPQVGQWLALPRSRRWLAIYNLWVLDGMLMDTYHWHHRLLYALSLTGPGKWCDMGMLIGSMTLSIEQPELWPCLLSYTERLFLLGIVDRVLLPATEGSGPGRHQEGTSGQVRLLMRLTSCGRHVLQGQMPAMLPDAGRFVVQPNLEVVAPAELQPALIWWLESTAKRRSFDRALVYAFTRESVEEAISHGVDGKELVALLAAHSEYPLPDNVRATLEGWVNQFNRLFLMEATILWCESEEVARQLRAAPWMTRYCLGSVSGRDLVIDGAQIGQVRSALKEAGYRLRSNVVRWDSCAPRESPEMASGPAPPRWQLTPQLRSLTEVMKSQELAVVPPKASTSKAPGTRLAAPGLLAGAQAIPELDRELLRLVDIALSQQRWLGLAERHSLDSRLFYPLARSGGRLAVYSPWEDEILVLALDQYAAATVGEQERRKDVLGGRSLPPGFF
jgi:hypothetical protein